MSVVLNCFVRLFFKQNSFIYDWSVFLHFIYKQLYCPGCTPGVVIKLVQPLLFFGFCSFCQFALRMGELHSSVSFYPHLSSPDIYPHRGCQMSQSTHQVSCRIPNRHNKILACKLTLQTSQTNKAIIYIYIYIYIIGVICNGSRFLLCLLNFLTFWGLL